MRRSVPGSADVPRNVRNRPSQPVTDTSRGAVAYRGRSGEASARGRLPLPADRARIHGSGCGLARPARKAPPDPSRRLCLQPRCPFPRGELDGGGAGRRAGLPARIAVSRRALRAGHELELGYRCSHVTQSSSPWTARSSDEEPRPSRPRCSSRNPMHLGRPNPARHRRFRHSWRTPTCTREGRRDRGLRSVRPTGRTRSQPRRSGISTAAGRAARSGRGRRVSERVRAAVLADQPLRRNA